MIYLKDQIVEDEDYKIEPIEDLIRIQKALFIYKDIYCTLDECGNLWQNLSWSMCASWLFIPDEYQGIIDYIEVRRDFKSYEEWIKMDEQ